MNFLFPNHLYFLIALSVPIIVHLFNFRRYKKVEFTNVRLLQDIESTTKSTRKLRNLLILLSRLLALTFLVLAFAQPFIPAANQGVNEKGRHVLIFLDNSFSMEEGESGNTLLEDGKDAAMEILNSLGDSKMYYFMSNDFSGTDNLEMSSEELLNSLNRTEISNESRSFNEIITRISGIGEENNLEQITTYIISDFQKSQLRLEEFSDMDSILDLRFIQIKSVNSSNLSLDSCWFESPVLSLNGIDTLWVSVSNYSDQALLDHPIRLFLNGRQTSLHSINLEPWSSETLGIVVQNNGFGTYSGRIESVDEGINQDDVLYLSFRIDSSLSIYHVGGNEEINNFRAVYQTSFNYVSDDEGSIDLSELSASQVIVLNISSELSMGLINEVSDHVKSGRALILYSTDTVDVTNANEVLSKFGLELFSRCDTAKLEMSGLNVQSDVLKGVIDRLPENPNLPRANSFYKLNEKTRLLKEDVLTFNNGASALRKYEYGKGNVYLYCFPLTRKSGNYLKHPLFVPISINMAYTNSSGRDLYYTLGREGMIEFTNYSYNQESVLHLKNDNIDVIPEVRVMANSNYLVMHNQISTAGIYSLSEENVNLDQLAFNYARGESNIYRYTEDELEEISGRSSHSGIQIVSGKGSELGGKIRMGNEARVLWKYCVILALMFFVAETLIIKFMKA